MGNQLQRHIEEAFNRLTDAFLSVIPALAILLTALLVGVVVGGALRLLLTFAGRLFLRRSAPDRVASRFLRTIGVKFGVESLAGTVSFWGAVAVALIVGVNALEPGALRTALDGAVAFLPRLLTGAFILLLGYAAAAVARRSVLLFAVNTGIPWARGAAQGVRIVILAFFVTTALEHLGVGRAILVAAFSIAAGGVVLALALAFGLGARDLAKSWLEKRLRAESEDTGIRHV
jgi:hypothetical protein